MKNLVISSLFIAAVTIPVFAQSAEAYGDNTPEMPMMGGSQGGMPMMGGGQSGMPMMRGSQGGMPMMRAHMSKMERHMENIEALLRQLVEQKK